MLGFQSFQTADSKFAGIEAMHRIRQGQAEIQRTVVSSVASFIERLFGLSASSAKPLTAHSTLLAIFAQNPMVSHTTIVFTRHILLAVEARNEPDPLTLDAFFLAMCDEMTDGRYVDANTLLLQLLALAIDPTISDNTAKIREAVQHLSPVCPVLSRCD